MEAEMDRFALEKKVRDLENQLETVRSEKKALQDRLRDAESQISQLKSAEAGRKRSHEELKRYARENVTREEIRQSPGRLRQTVGQIEGKKRKKEEQIAEYEERIHRLRPFLETYRKDIEYFNTQLQEEMSRHAPLYGDGLDALSMEELERISHIHEEGLRQIHAIQQQHEDSPLSSPIMSPQTLPPHNQGLYPTVPPQVVVGLPPSVMPNGVGMHHSNGHVNDELKKVVEEKDALAERLKSAEAGRKRSYEELKRYARENVTREEIRQSLEDEIRRLRQTVRQIKGEKQKKGEWIAEYEERIHGLRAHLQAYREYIKLLNTELGEEMSRHAPLDGDGLDALSMTELERISHIHEEGLRQIHAIQQQRKGSPLSSPIVSPHK